MSCARSAIARLCTAVAITLALIVLTASAGSAETRRIVVRVYETGAGDPTTRATAIKTASDIVALAGVAVEWYDCTENGRRPVCQDARRSGNFIARIMPALSPGSMPRKPSIEAPRPRPRP
jgi:hypothetical protein